MKILMVIDGMLPEVLNGLSVHTHSLAPRLAKLCELTILSVQASTTKQGLQVSGENPYRCVTLFYRNTITQKLPPNTPDGWLRVTSALEEHWGEVANFIASEHFDLIHFQDYYCSLLAYLADRATGRPLPKVTTVHALSTNPRHFKEAMRGYIVANSRYVIAVSNWERQQIVDRFAVDPARVITVYNGVELPESGEVIASRKQEQPQKYITFAGRLVPLKGCSVFLQAAAVLGTDYFKKHGLELCIMGDGEERASLENLVREEKLEEICHFLGKVSPEEVRSHMRCSAVHVIPSRTETFGLVATEALSEGTKVVVSQGGALPEVIQGSKLAFSFPTGDVTQLAKQLKEAIEQKSNMEDILAEIDRLRRQFSWEVIAQQTYSVYQRAVNADER